jgi:UDP-N-acetylmuramate dehydrogenase
MNGILEDCIIKKLSDAGCVFDEETLLCDLCSFKIGGRPGYFVKIPSENALEAFLDIVCRSGAPYLFLGGGTNVLFPDSANRRIIAKLTGEFEEIFIKGDFVSCGAGASLPLLVKKTASENLSGLECCAGIPGSAGGAVFGNAGSAENWIGDAVESVEVYKKSPDNIFEKSVLKMDEIPFGYRKSGLEGCVISKIDFALKKETGNDILKTVTEIIEKRVKTQPLSLPNAGCVFKNPAGLSAGQLIDDAGLKGRKKGGAKVSEAHANFIVNTGGATYDDVLDLIYIVRRTVKEKFNIDLELELKILDR